MPAYVLTHEQIRTALAMADIGTGPGSPLAALPEIERPLVRADAAFQKMADGHLVEAAPDGSWRVNTLFKAVLLACAQPEEVISLRTMGQQQAGFAVCRRGPMLCECTVGATGLTKVAFPLTRSSILLMLASALSGDRPEPAPTGFRFQGRAADAFVLSLLLNEARQNSSGIPTAELAARVATAVENPALTLPFTLVSGAVPLLTLATSPGAVEEAVARLIASGHALNDGGWLRPSGAAMNALASPPAAGFTVNRTLVGPEGAASQPLEVARCGERTIVFRSLHHRGEEPLLEWSEVSRRQLRALVAATVMDERELAVATSPQPAAPPAPEAVATPAAAPAGLFCANCGQAARPGQRFCRACGARLVED